LNKNKETLSKSLSLTFSQNSSNFKVRGNPSFYFQGREGKNIVNLDEEHIPESLP
jgi:thioredoxin-related protein